MSDFYPHLERRKQDNQSRRHRLLLALAIVLPALILGFLGPPLGSLSHHIATEYMEADTTTEAKQTRDHMAPQVELDDPFSNRRTLPQLQGRQDRRVAGPSWSGSEQDARLVDEPDIGFAFRIHDAWVCRVTPNEKIVTAKCFGSEVRSVLQLRKVVCTSGCSDGTRTGIDNEATRGLTGDPVELKRISDRTRYLEIKSGDRYVLLVTHIYTFQDQTLHLTLMSDGPPGDEAGKMQMAINDAITQAG